MPIIKTGVLVASLSMLFGLSGCASADGDHGAIGDAIKDVPIFDAHIHYKEPAWSAYPVDSVIELMDKNGVAMGLVSSTPDAGTIMLWQHAPNRIVPELRPYHGDAGSSNWTKAEGMQGYLETRLAAYPHEGIGEFHIHRIDRADEPLFRQVIKMAKERDIFLHVHSGAEPIGWLYELDSAVKIIWAHAGLSDPAKTVFDTMRSYPELVADTSFRESDILTARGTIDPQWREIIETYQDRLMVGSDTWVNSQWDSYSEIIATNREWLSQFPRGIAEKIAYKNAERLFSRDVTMQLIGQK